MPQQDRAEALHSPADALSLWGPHPTSSHRWGLSVVSDPSNEAPKAAGMSEYYYSSRNKLTLCAMSAPSVPTKIRRAPSYCLPSHLNIPVKALTSSGLASIEWGPRGVS